MSGAEADGPAPRRTARCPGRRRVRCRRPRARRTAAARAASCSSWTAPNWRRRAAGGTRPAPARRGSTSPWTARRGRWPPAAGTRRPAAAPSPTSHPGSRPDAAAGAQEPVDPEARAARSCAPTSAGVSPRGPASASAGRSARPEPTRAGRRAAAAGRSRRAGPAEIRDLVLAQHRPAQDVAGPALRQVHDLGEHRGPARRVPRPADAPAHARAARHRRGRNGRAAARPTDRRPSRSAPGSRRRAIASSDSATTAATTSNAAGSGRSSGPRRASASSGSIDDLPAARGNGVRQLSVQERVLAGPRCPALLAAF